VTYCHAVVFERLTRLEGLPPWDARFLQAVPLTGQACTDEETHAKAQDY
jgi:hypothetical protein